MQNTPPIDSDLFKFAYLGNWPVQLRSLAALAAPEGWRFIKPDFEASNQDTPILERLLLQVFRKLSNDYAYADDPYKEAECIYMDAHTACFHTSLYTPQGEGIYALLVENTRRNTMLQWRLQAFVTESSSALPRVQPLPAHPAFYMADYASAFYLDWPIFLQEDKLLNNPYDLATVHWTLRERDALAPRLRKAIVESRHLAESIPDFAAPQVLSGRVQYLLPLYLTKAQQPDIAVSLSVMEGYYVAHSFVPLEMAYHRARLWMPVRAHWLKALVISETARHGEAWEAMA